MIDSWKELQPQELGLDAAALRFVELLLDALVVKKLRWPVVVVAADLELGPSDDLVPASPFLWRLTFLISLCL